MTVRGPASEKTIVFNLTATFFSIVISFILLEISLSTLRPALTYERAKYMSPGFYSHSEFIPLELKPGYSKQTYLRETGTSFHFTINSHGFRGPEFQLEKPDTCFRILLLGDSFAINEALPDDFLHTVLLEKMLAKDAPPHCKVEVINCGYADAISPDTYAAFMLNRGFGLSPGMVIMQYFIYNDFSDLLENETLAYQNGLPLKVRSKYRYIDENGRLRRRAYVIHRIPLLRDSHLYIHFCTLFKIRSLFLSILTRITGDYWGGFGVNSYGITYRHVYVDSEERPPILQKAFIKSLEYVNAISKECRKRGIDFVLFVVPTGVQMSEKIFLKKFSDLSPGLQDYIEHWDNPAPQRQILEELSDSGIDILNPIEYFREQAMNEVLYLGPDADGHWTKAGSRVAAEAIYDHVKKRYEVRCTKRENIHK